jgi:hypothetical protein
MFTDTHTACVAIALGLTAFKKSIAAGSKSSINEDRGVLSVVSVACCQVEVSATG